MAKTPFSNMADYAQSLLSSQRSQQLQESFVNFLKSIGSDAPARPRGDIIGSQSPQPGTIDQLFPQRQPSPSSTLPPPDIAAPNPGGGMVPQSVLTDIQSRPPEVPAPQGVWDPAIEAVNRRSAEEAARVLRGEQELANIAASAAAEQSAARAAKDAPGYVDGLLSRFGLGRKAPEAPVKVAAPEGYDEALDAAKFREQQLVSGRTDNLRGQDKALNDFKRGLIGERQEKAALEYVKKADAMERQQRISDQIKSGVEGLRTAAPMVGALGAAVTGPAIVAGMANARSPMAPNRKEPATTADLASTVPSIEATPDEPMPQAPAPQPSYMAQNPGAPAPLPQKPQAELLDEGLKFFGADTRPEVTPEQRAKAAADYNNLQKSNYYANQEDPSGRSLLAEAPIVAQSQDEDRRLAAMASDQDLAHMEEVQRQEESNARMAAMAKGVSKPQAAPKQAPMDVLPSDNLAAVEQQISPEPMVKSKPKPIATASAYDNPTGTRFNQLIQSLAVKTGMTPEQARAIYQENTAKGLSPRQAMQPLIDMGQTAFMNGEKGRKDNVARAAMLDPRNPRRESNAFGMMTKADQEFAAASRFTNNPGIAPRDVAHQQWAEEVRAKEALAARANELEKARIETQGPVNQAMWTAGGQMVGAGLGAVGAYFQTQAALQAAAQEQASRERAAAIAAKGVVDAAGEHNKPRPPGPEDLAQADLYTTQAAAMKKAMEAGDKKKAYELGDAVHGSPGGSEAIANNRFRMPAAMTALENLALAAKAKNTKGWNVDLDRAAASFDESLASLGVEQPNLRAQLVEEYIRSNVARSAPPAARETDWSAGAGAL